MRLPPTFIGIGAQRTGTTWMHHVLITHPQVSMASPKELHFFDRLPDDLSEAPVPIERSRLDRYRYARLFGSNWRRYKAVGEITPAYATLPDASVATIARWMPDLQILYSMRDPIERAWSHVRKQLVGRHAEEFDAFTVEQALAIARSPAVEARTDYAATIERWFRYFPRHQFHFVLYEDIPTRPLELARDLFHFLGVDESHHPGDELNVRRNARLPAPMPDEVRAYLVERYADQQDRVAQLTGLQPSWPSLE